MRLADVRLPLAGVILRQRPVDDFRARAGQLLNELGKLAHRELSWVAEVDRADDVLLGLHQADETAYEVVDVAEGPRLLSVAKEGDVLV